MFINKDTQKFFGHAEERKDGFPKVDYSDINSIANALVDIHENFLEDNDHFIQWYINDIEYLTHNNKIKYLEKEQMEYLDLIRYDHTKDYLVDQNSRLTSNSIKHHVFTNYKWFVLGEQIDNSKHKNTLEACENLVRESMDTITNINMIALLSKLIDYVNIKPTKIRGLNTNLNSEKLKKVYYPLLNNEIMYTDLNNFLRIFGSNTELEVKPIQWNIISERARKSSRGNQTALYVFLKMLIGKEPNSYIKKKAAELFIDHKGHFMKEKLSNFNKDNYTTEYGFESIFKLKRKF